MLSLLAFIMTGCKDTDEFNQNGEPVRVELACTFSSSVGKQTRQVDDLVQNVDLRQPITRSLRVIAMQDNEPMRSEVYWEDPVSKDRARDKPASVLYHSSYCNMAQGVNRCLVYGDVEDAPAAGNIPIKVYNGSLIKSSLNNIMTYSGLQNISFNLESIYNSTDVPSGDDGPTPLAEALTNVANLADWKGSNNTILKNLRQNFTNHGFNLPGSAASVRKWLEALASAAQSYYDNPSGLTSVEKAILLQIKAASIAAVDNITSNNYPRNLYLPDGAAALRWVESTSGGSFQPQMQTTTIDNINTVSRFAYPAALYYFVDSEIKTSNSKVDSYATDFDDVSTDESSTAWEQVLAEFDDGYVVSASTKAIALKDPVQYAVAQLHVTLKANGTTIKDDADADITIGQNFPLKGIIVCGQRPVNYLFAQRSNSDVEVKFIYDSQVEEDCSLSTTQQDACKTLVLQSYDSEDVNIILEFENNSNDLTFKCIDGTVYPHTRFYLAGKVVAAGGTGGDDASRGRVFTKDYITTVNMTVTSLAKAYNVLPNLLTSNLEIGVETTPDWIAVTPTVVRME